MKLFRIAALSCLAATAAATASAPVHAQRMTAPTSSPVTKTSAKKAEPLTGFQDVKWGESIAKATKILEAKGATVEKAVGFNNTLRVSNLKVAGYETLLLALRFGNEGFYQASIVFSVPQSSDANKVYNDVRLIVAERFGEAMPDRSGGGLGGGGFGGGGYNQTSEWNFTPSDKEVASLKLINDGSSLIRLEYRATDRAEREEARIRAEKAKIAVGRSEKLRQNFIVEMNRLQPLAFSPLPLGSVRPAGWLRSQLTVQANGLTGHLDEFWPSVADSKWIGGSDEGWERGPYWLDGLVPLAVLLQDEWLLAKARKWVDAILARQQGDGWLGPKNDEEAKPLDPWPQFVVFKAFTQWYEATGDARIIPALLRAARRIQALLETEPLRSWAKMRWADLSLSLFWLHERTGENWLLDLARTLRAQGYDWQTHFADLPGKERTDPAYLKTLSWDDALVLHGVNNAMGVKSGAVWFRQTGEKSDLRNSLLAVETLDRYHGQVTGMFSGDEHLAGKSPIQGTETCTVTEYLFSLEQTLAITGDPCIADRMEQIAYNALPAALTKDMWARQYDQQPNQVLCSVARRDWVSNGPDSNLFSLEGHFGCCTANLHQGWPRFVASVWMKTNGGENSANGEEGLAAVAYGPCVVQTTVNGASVTITETTDYPFRGDVSLAIETDAPATFALQLRIPEWADGATVRVNDEAAQTAPEAGSFFTVRRDWKTGDTVTLHLPLHLRRETRYCGAVSLLRGPLVMALHIGEKREQVGGTAPHADWAVHPTTPWNYGLRLPANDASLAAFPVEEIPVSSLPFAGDAPPVVISAPAYRLPQWKMVNDSAAPLSESAFAPPQGTLTETVSLVPYGSTLLRISEFPVTTA